MMTTTLAKHLNLHPRGLQKVFPKRRTRSGVLISPAKAEEYLTKNFEGQRPPSPTQIHSLAAKMKAGAFVDTGQGILFDYYGRLIDGQHRLYAIIESGVSVHLTITEGVEPEAFLHLDEDVKGRTLKDILGSGQMKRPSAAAAAFRMALSYNNLEHRQERDRGFVSFGHSTSGAWRDNRESAAEWCMKHQKQLEHITEKLNSKDAKNLLAPISVFSGFYLWAYLDNPTKADAFFDTLIEGASFPLGKKDPIYQLRRSLMEFARRKREARDPTPYYVYGALLVKAWNAFYTNEGVKMLRFTINESWPKRRGAKPLSGTSLTESNGAAVTMISRSKGAAKNAN